MIGDSKDLVVLRSDRHFYLPSLGVQLRTVALLHPALRVHVVDNRGVVCEDALGLPSFPRVGQPTRPIVTIVLDGEARVRLADGSTRWLKTHSIAYFPRKNELIMRQEGARYRSIVLEFDAALADQRPHAQVAQLSDQQSMALQDWADVLCRVDERTSDTMSAAEHTFQLLKRLNAEGISLLIPSPYDLALVLDRDTLDLATLLDRSLSRLADRPARVDIEDSVSLRTRVLTDQIAAFHRRFGFNADGWRDALLRRRVLVGAAAMSAPKAKTEVVSAALGYSSPTVFCRALAKANLPSPAHIISALKHLR
jgi:hypothetical protein